MGFCLKVESGKKIKLKIEKKIDLFFDHRCYGSTMA